jgi:hypothetical protein
LASKTLAQCRQRRFRQPSPSCRECRGTRCRGVHTTSRTIGRWYGADKLNLSFCDERNWLSAPTVPPVSRPRTPRLTGATILSTELANVSSVVLPNSFVRAALPILANRPDQPIIPAKSPRRLEGRPAIAADSCRAPSGFEATPARPDRIAGAAPELVFCAQVTSEMPAPEAILANHVRLHKLRQRWQHASIHSHLLARRVARRTGPRRGLFKRGTQPRTAAKARV